jgi:hypothetical protein
MNPSDAKLNANFHVLTSLTLTECAEMEENMLIASQGQRDQAQNLDEG